jgi:uncharacterized protein (TIGR02145 family)
MDLKCKIGIHTWNGCKCIKCGKTRDVKHDYVNNICTNCGKGTFTDARDGKTYKIVKIGEQTIMAENLAFKPTSGNFWAYKNDKSNIVTYGYLYDWQNARNVTPDGWHLPGIEEFNTLIKDVGGRKKAYKALIKGGYSGFSALFGGFCKFHDGLKPLRGHNYGLPRESEREPYVTFHSLGTGTKFWSSSERSHPLIYGLELNYLNKTIDLPAENSSHGYSVRCIKDK